MNRWIWRWIRELLEISRNSPVIPSLLWHLEMFADDDPWLLWVDVGGEG